jgi:endonuclease YncB( thermonuclease family)
MTLRSVDVGSSIDCCAASINFAAVLLLAFFASGAHAAEVISGVPRIVDGDTLEIGTTKIRLASIDAPESDQVCLDANRKCWTCGIEARDRLAAHIGNRPVDCTPTGLDTYARTLARCTVAGENLNAWMVRQGWALAFVRYSKEYVADEEAARAVGRGLWSGAFIAPWDWRHRNGQTIVLGATSVPISAQAELLAPSSAASAPSPQCIIKGNINRRGERIYFRPGQLDYARVDMGKSGRRWFCTEQDAQAAGWRPAAR